MKRIISALILLGSVNVFAFGEYSEELKTLAASRGFTKFSNYCEAGAMYGQGAKGNLDLTIREYKNDKGEALTIVNYMINETADEHYDMTDIIPLSITKAIQSKDVKGTRISVLLEDVLTEEYELKTKMNVSLEGLKPRGYESKTKGALAQLLLGVSEEELATIPEEKLELKRININKFTKNYDLNDDVYIECDSKI